MCCIMGFFEIFMLSVIMVLKSLISVCYVQRDDNLMIIKKFVIFVFVDYFL